MTQRKYDVEKITQDTMFEMATQFQETLKSAEPPDDPSLSQEEQKRRRGAAALRKVEELIQFYDLA